jgi:hypothetical protein
MRQPENQTGNDRSGNGRNIDICTEPGEQRYA